MQKFDTDILFDFIPDVDKPSFLVWVSCREYKNIGPHRIVATYRTLLDEEKVIIPANLYEERVKQKEREKKINEILK